MTASNNFIIFFLSLLLDFLHLIWFEGVQKLGYTKYTSISSLFNSNLTQDLLIVEVPRFMTFLGNAHNISLYMETFMLQYIELAKKEKYNKQLALVYIS